MSSAISPILPAITKLQILDALICAAFELHSGGRAVLECAKVLFGNVPVANAVEEREEDEKNVGMNGHWGESGAFTALARAYFLLIEHGEDANAEEVKKIAMSRFIKAGFEAQVAKIREGG